MLDSGDEDLFAISDEDTAFLLQSVQSNPVEEHLLKQLNDVQNRINNTTDEIEEVKTTSAHILNALKWRALYGDDVALDSDSELYTIEGKPVMMKKQCQRTSNPTKNLETTSQWQCILHDKWIIGVELQNKSQRILVNPRYYPSIRDKVEIHGVSMFWQLQADNLWQKIDMISPSAIHIVATVALELPTFDQESVVDCWGTILYEIDEVQFQTPVPLVQLSTAETIDRSCMKLLDQSDHSVILSLKSTSSIEKIVDVQFSKTAGREEYMSKRRQLFNFLAKKAFRKVYGDVFLVTAHDSLMYCLIEVLSIKDEARIRIFARSVNQLNIILHLLRDEFPNVTVKEDVDNLVGAAMALIRELEIIRDKGTAIEIQEAKLITDLLIP